MTTIEQQIAKWTALLITAGNPTEQAAIELEIKRLKRIARTIKKKPDEKTKEDQVVMPEPVTSDGPPVVFVIHGHDSPMKREVQLFINRCGLRDRVGHEEADISGSILDKLTSDKDLPVYAIAALSPDDTQHDGSLWARQNVIFEIGYFMGLLGRKKVRLLRQAGTAIPSDLQGILYTNYDEEGAWRVKLAKEMRAVGIPVNEERLVDAF